MTGLGDMRDSRFPMKSVIVGIFLFLFICSHSSAIERTVYASGSAFSPANALISFNSPLEPNILNDTVDPLYGLVSDGTVLYTSHGSGSIRKYSLSGEYLEDFVQFPCDVSVNCVFYGLERGNSGELYGIYQEVSYRVSKNGDIEVVSENSTKGIDADRHGRIYVLESNRPTGPRHELVRYSPDLVRETSVQLPNIFFSSIAIDEIGELLFLGDEGEGAIRIYDISSDNITLLDEIALPGQAVFDLEFDPWSGNVLAALILGGAFYEVSLDGTVVPYFSNPYLLGVGIASLVSGDYLNDGQFNTSDIDLLVEGVASGTFASHFDLNADEILDSSDIDEWLNLASEVNLPPGTTYLPGDANLDGKVDGQDFIAWNKHKFTATASWSAGDFNADGIVDGADYLILDANLFQ